MNMKTMGRAAAVLVVGLAGAATAATANGPVCNTAATVSSTTYYSCSGSSHTALDIGGVACGEPFYAPLVGSYFYKLYGGCAATCTGDTCNGGAGNYYVVTGTNGWDFRMLHLITDAYSASKTCNGCRLGQVGGTGSATSAHVHLDNRQYGTRKTSWYTGAGTTCGSSAYCGNVIGYPTL
ncbi:MAG TPA: peptidase M23 [Archangium sp.]|nr:peptidase M23 [Archangium sp.]